MRATPTRDVDDLGPCPTGADPACVSTGELPADEWRVIGPHVKRCAACQAELRTIHGMVDAWAQAQASSDAPSAAVRDSVAATVPVIQPWRDVRRWLAFAAVLLAVILTKTIAHTPPSAYADEILERLARQETAVLSRNGVLFWNVDARHGRQSTAIRESQEALRDRLFALLEAHGFDPKRPFAADAIRAWRASLPPHRSHVSKDRAHLIVRFTVEDGVLRELELVIDEVRFDIVKLAWVFVQEGRIECLVPQQQEPGDRTDATAGGSR